MKAHELPIAGSQAGFRSQAHQGNREECHDRKVKKRDYQVLSQAAKFKFGLCSEQLDSQVLHARYDRSRCPRSVYRIGIREKEIVSMSMLRQLVAGIIFPYPSFWQ
jgi:hypothetical protein